VSALLKAIVGDEKSIMINPYRKLVRLLKDSSASSFQSISGQAELKGLQIRRLEHRTRVSLAQNRFRDSGSARSV
jgi:hypothetical protein